MTPTPGPVPPTVAATAQWWQIAGALSPLAILLAAIVAGIVGLLTLRQKARADNRAEWWRRAQWALDASTSKSTSAAAMGQKAIALLARSELATDEELALLKISTDDPLKAADKARRAEDLDQGISTRTRGNHSSETRVAAPSRRPSSVSPEDRKVQIAAAQARLVLHDRLGDETPDWIIALSKEQPE